MGRDTRIEFPEQAPDVGATSTDVADEAGAGLSAREPRSALLSDACAVLLSSLDYDDTLSQLVRLIVPTLADWCVIDIAGEAGASVPSHLVHRDPDRGELLREVWRGDCGEVVGPLAVAEVLRSGQAAWLPEVSTADPPSKLQSEVGLESALIVPMVAHGHSLGTITLALGGSGRRFGSLDLALASELGQLTGSAISNARLYMQVAQAGRAREELLGMAAHDLRNPLAGMLMRCSLLLETLPKDEAGMLVRRDVEAMRRSAYRMESLLRGLLDFTKIQGGGLPVERAPVRVADAFAEAVEAIAPLAGKRKLSVDSAALDPELEIRCDRERFLQVFSNLVSNAIKFTKPDGKIGIRAERVGDELRVSVSDDGPGVGADELPWLFQKYWQKSPRSGAVGLGLYVAKSLVEAQGGQIGLASSSAAGSTFFFALPIAGPVPAAQPERSATILVVDDDPSFRGELAAVLSAEGYHVAQAQNGREALQYLRGRSAPCLILTDLMMPHMDGWELAAALRSDAKLSAIPLVAMSSTPRSQDGAALFGVEAQLSKPLRRERLVELAARYRNFGS